MKGSSIGKLCVLLALLFIMNTLGIPSASSELPLRYFPSQGGAGVATLYVTPQYNNFASAPPTVSRINTTFTVSVRIANATHIACWQVELWYNKNYLYANSSLVEYPSDMIFPPGTHTFPAPMFLINSYNSTHNYVVMTTSAIGGVEYNATDKGLMQVSFKIIADPTPGQKLSSMLYLMNEPGNWGGTWTGDAQTLSNELWLRDGYYENRYALLEGDVNEDAKVDGRDIAIGAKAYGTMPGDPLWDARADVNGDYKIDGRDIAVISKHFGETYRYPNPG